MYKVIIVGLGQIGIGYDIYTNENILTHTKALVMHQKFNLCGGVDKDPARRKILETHYSIPTFEAIRDAVESKPDVIVVSTPTKTHRSIVVDILNVYTPRLILCEKPLGGKVRDAEEVLGLAEDKGAKVAVNYVRRFEPSAIDVKDKIKRGCLGSNVSGFARYSNGLVNNGSHMVNLLQFWLGDCFVADELVPNGRYRSNSRDPDLLLRFSAGDVILRAYESSSFSIFELDLLGSHGRIRYEAGGRKIIWWGIEDNQHFPDSKVLSWTPREEIETDLLRYQLHVYEHIANFLSTSEYVLPCTGRDALKTLEILKPWLGESSG